MKVLIFTSLLLISLFTNAQQTVVFADPALKQINFTSDVNPGISPNSLPLDAIINLNIPMFNLNVVNGIPSQSCKININLGTKLKIDPFFDFSALPSSNYINWGIFLNGQVITGDVLSDLPANYKDTLKLKVKGFLQGNSTVVANFLVPNNNSAYVLSDENPTNNNSSLSYTVVPAGSLPVTFTGLTATNKGCVIDVDFYTERELNVSRYEVEISKDGLVYSKTGEVMAANLPHYEFNFAITDANKASQLFIRIKSIDKDGSFKYSMTKSVKATCGNLWILTAYPNPAKNVSSITIATKEKLFNGVYNVILSDIAGKKVLLKQLNLSAASQFKLDIGNLAAGQYIISILNTNEGDATNIKWQKF